MGIAFQVLPFCHRIIGGYELNGNSLNFAGIASTMMLCFDDLETESAFVYALRNVKSWKISGQNLDLFNGEGNCYLNSKRVHPSSDICRLMAGPMLPSIRCAGKHLPRVSRGLVNGASRGMSPRSPVHLDGEPIPRRRA